MLLSLLAQAAAEFGGVAQTDLAPRAEAVIVVDREPGRYVGHPTTVTLADGRTVLCAYPLGHGKGPIVLKRSEDGGRTWSARLPVPENWATSQETPTLHRVPRPEGGERLLLFSGLHPIRMAHSEDMGRTWSPLAPIGDFGGIVAMSSVAPTRDGALLAWFHDDGRFLGPEGAPAPPGPRFRVYQSRSADGGLTWSAPSEIAARADADLCEPGFVRAPDGGAIALLLRENSRKKNSFIMFSEDEGAAWSAPRELPAALTGDRHVVAHLADGRLAISLRDMAADSPWRGDWILWLGSWDDLTSGRPGARRLRLLDNLNAWDCGYAGLDTLADGALLAVSYGHWSAGEPPWVAALRLTPADLAP